MGVDKVVVSVIGSDCPGVVHAVSSTLSALQCNIEELSQTILKNQFAGIFIVTLPPSLDHEEVRRRVSESVGENGMHLSVTIRPFEDPVFVASACEPFVVTVDGEDRLEIISRLSGIFRAHGVNIENLKAIRPEDAPHRCVLVFEIALPLTIDRSAFRQTLQDEARELGLHLSMQHRDIFEAVHRVLSV